ncbi:MAG TPA: cysteine desulfurase family protein [Azospirillaceae bacterium]|nr:cysteine desulfurase family protein [Azospirillaceae bacterium]
MTRSAAPAGQAYLDWNATAPLRPEARAAMLEALDEAGNPSSVHAFGRRARRRVEDARAAVAALAGADAAGVVFTGSGTEANNLALAAAPERRLLVSAVEHASVLEAAPGASRIPVDGQGRVDPDALGRLLAGGPPALVSVMAANNETGVLQPLEEIARVARSHGALLHVDAAQAAGRVPFDMGVLGVDLATLSAHKLGGPQGVGALLLRPGLEPRPLLRGGGQERRRRAGTENVAGIAGFGAAARAALAGLGAYADVAALRDRLEAAVMAEAPEARIAGRDAPRLPNTSCIALPGVPAETQLMALDLAGVAVSSGSACSSGKVKVSHVLEAMGWPAELAGCAVRVSLGWDSRADEVERFLAAWTALRNRAAAKRGC